MKRTLISAIITLTAASVATLPALGDAPALQPTRVEVCFVLDTTGSMGGLIEGAKQKIWSIANDIASAKPTPKIRFGLVGYRDRGDAYVTQVSDLTDDLDAIHEKLMKSKADGGGDGPESVNQALHEAVTKMTWSDDRKVLKIIFLVGDAPPHMDYQDDVKYPETCKLAMKKDLIINTIQCGNMADTRTFWADIAAKAEGSYAAIGQTGDMVVMATPMDADIAKLTTELASTSIGYGDAAPVRRKATAAKSIAATAAPAAAERAEFVLREASVEAKDYASVGGRKRLAEDARAGRTDLLVAVQHGALKVEDLDAAKLPPAIAKMEPEKRKEYIEHQIAKKKDLESRLNGLIDKRSAYVEAEKAKTSPDAKTGFDEEVADMIRTQAGRKGITY